jgi:hypothetical protein
MMHSSTYRVCAIALAVVFGLFNIGLPVVFAACPMMGRLSEPPPCCTQHHQNASTAGAPAFTKNCCKTILAGERNRTEFLGERHGSDLSPATVSSSVTPLCIPAGEFLLKAPVRYVDPSPPDIPIFTASLLI